MTEAEMRRHLEKLVVDGAVASVVFADGLTLAPVPLAWLRLEDGHLEFLWIGDDARQHGHEVADWTEDDGAVAFRQADGLTVTIEGLWQPQWRAWLDEWAQILARGEVHRVYPEGGWLYAGIPDHPRTPF